MNHLRKVFDHYVWIPSERRKPFFKVLSRWSFLILLLVLLFAGDWMGTNVVFDPASKWFGDILLRTRTAEVPRCTRLIRIYDKDRDEVLRGQTPVHGAALVRAVCAIAAQKPRIIVVDIDTSSEKSFPKGPDRLPDFHGVPVVWAVNAEWGAENGRLALQSNRFLGGNHLADHYGIARMPVDFDGVIRQWYRSVDVNGKPELSLTEKAVQLYCAGRCPPPGEPSFATSYVFPELLLRDFVPPPRESSACPASDLSNKSPVPLGDMAVVLGAVHPVEDRHDTSWGTKPGVELVAMSIEESLNPHTRGKLGLCKWLLKVALAIAVVALHHYLWPIAATLFTVLFLTVGVLVSGAAMFWFGEHHLPVVPIVVGVLLEHIATSAEKGQHYAQHD